MLTQEDFSELERRLEPIIVRAVGRTVEPIVERIVTEKVELIVERIVMEKVEPIVERVVIKYVQPIREEVESLARVFGKAFARAEERISILEKRTDKTEDYIAQLSEFRVKDFHTSP
jgi:ABC-type enterochelin transport system substrate-binding protein